MEERIQKILAAAGIASRRKAEEIIAAGRVTVNGEIVDTLGAKADPGQDKIAVDGKEIGRKERKAYVLMNKPVGYLCTVSDTHDRPTVLDLIPNHSLRLYPVGRLDMDTSGLLLLTNDGTFTQQILHPANKLDKVYRAKVTGMPTKDELKLLRQGVEVDDEIYKADSVRFLTRKGRESVWEIVLHEGKKRQIRQMFKGIKHPVITLERVRIGNLGIGELKPGEWRFLKKSEMRALLERGRQKQNHPSPIPQIKTRRKKGKPF